MKARVEGKEYPGNGRRISFFFTSFSCFFLIPISPFHPHIPFYETVETLTDFFTSS